jgi:tetratricopeptide (TPR) repeat protein
VISRVITNRWFLRCLIIVVVVGIAAPQLWAWSRLRNARAALARYHPEEARRELDSCRKVWGWGDSQHLRLLACRAAWQDGDLEVAVEELRQAQRLAGRATDETAFEWALIQASAGHVRDVEEFLQKRALNSAEAAPVVWEALSVGYLRLYRSLDAMACVNRWLKDDPNNVRALELRGATFVTGKGLVKGAEDYRRVLGIDPKRSKTRWQLVGCLLNLGGYDEAAEHLEWLSRESPNNNEILPRLARCYFLLNRSDEGRRLLENALNKDPDNGLCLRTLGQLELTEGRRPQAEQLLRRAVVSLPTDYQSNWLLFQALQQQGKTQQAKEQLALSERIKERNEQFSELTSRKLPDNPLDPGLHYEMGTILMRGGNTAAGLQWLQSALELDPAHQPSHAALAEYYEQAGEKSKAAEHRGRSHAPESK